MAWNDKIFTPEHPCRCGFTGEGDHRCHMCRELGPEVQCPRLALDRVVATKGALSGMQMKASCTTGHYCAEHWAMFDLDQDPTVESMAEAHRISVEEMTSRIMKPRYQRR